MCIIEICAAAGGNFRPILYIPISVLIILMHIYVHIVG